MQHGDKSTIYGKINVPRRSISKYYKIIGMRWYKLSKYGNNIIQGDKLNIYSIINAPQW